MKPAWILLGVLTLFRVGVALGFESSPASSVLQGDGKILVVGEASDVDQDGISYRAIAIARYYKNGLDVLFGKNGTAQFTRPECNVIFRASTVALQDDGKIVVGGSCGSGDSSDYVYPLLMRLTDKGELDASFGDRGYVLLPPEGAVKSLSEMTNVSIQKDGKILGAGYYIIRGEQGILMVRFDSNGKADSSFGSHGTKKVVLDRSGVSSLEIKPDGRIFLSGIVCTYSGSGCPDDQTKFWMAQYTSQGEEDPTFHGGRIAIDPVGNFIGGNSYRLGDGRLLVAGSASNGIELRRYLVDGSPDPSFGIGGRVVKLLPNLTANGAMVIEDGHITLSGVNVNISNHHRAAYLYQCSLEGEANETFGNHGLVWTDASLGDVYGLHHAEDYLWMVTDLVDDPAGEALGDSFSMARYSLSGVLDTSYGDKGILQTTFEPKL
jgi:uncharacterized delta-60 repeat protein